MAALAYLSNNDAKTVSKWETDDTLVQALQRYEDAHSVHSSALEPNVPPSSVAAAVVEAQERGNSKEIPRGGGGVGGRVGVGVGVRDIKALQDRALERFRGALWGTPDKYR